MEVVFKFDLSKACCLLVIKLFLVLHQCLAEEDRDDVTGTKSPQEIQASPEKEGDTKHSSPENAAAQDDLPDTLPEFLLQPSDSSQSHCALGETEKEPNNEIQFESLESENGNKETRGASGNVLEEHSLEKDGENTLSEPDQPECDRNSSESQQNASLDSVQIKGVHTAPVTVESEDCSTGASSSSVSTLNIPRVSSHGELEKIQNSVQALIDKTSGFLDSYPPSTISSMSDLDQAGLNALSSTKMFDTARRDTPSPGAQSPQQNTNSSHFHNILHSQAPSSGAQPQSSASHDNSCLPADVNGRSSNNVPTASQEGAQITDTEEDLLSQLDAELDSNNDNNGSHAQSVESGDAENPNGLIQRNVNLTHISEYKKLLSECEMLRKQTDEQQQRIKR